MILLALDTATQAITAALHDGESVLARRAVLDARRHSEELAPAIEATLAQCGLGPQQLTAIAVGEGPGPFTGLRVGLVTAAAMGHALGIPVHGICSLDAIAHDVAQNPDAAPEFLVATDARRKEVYWARYRLVAGIAQRQGEPQVHRPEDLDPGLRALPTAGRGPLLFPGVFPHALAHLDVDAGALAALAVADLGRGPARAPRPRYLRRPDAHEPGAPKSTLLPARKGAS